MKGLSVPKEEEPLSPLCPRCGYLSERPHAALCPRCGEIIPQAGGCSGCGRCRRRSR